MKTVVLLFALIGTSVGEMRSEIVDADKGICVVYKELTDLVPSWKLGVVPGVPHKFLSFPVDSEIPSGTLNCPLATIFDVNLCDCGDDPNYKPTTEDDEGTRLMCTRFDDMSASEIAWGFNAGTPNLPVYVGNTDNRVVLTAGDKKGGGQSAYFDGTGRLEVYHFAGNYQTISRKFVIHFDFMRNGGTTGDMTLLSNANCYNDLNPSGDNPDASLSLVSHDDGSVTAKVISYNPDDGSTDTAEVVVSGLESGKWHTFHVVYHNEDRNGEGSLTVKLPKGGKPGRPGRPGKSLKDRIAPGKLDQRMCSLEFGRGFEGFMDNICVLK